MKMIHLLIPFTIYCSVFLFDLALGFTDNSQIDISVKGVDHDIVKNGIRPEEFEELSIALKDDNMHIEGFQINLARGNRAVDISDIRGNAFNLKKFTSMARAGDRIVIEVKDTSIRQNHLPSDGFIVALVVK